MKRSVLGATLFALLGAIVGVVVVDADCGPRVRKSYDRLTVDEKLLYRNALRKAMDSGAYIKFVEMHTEKMSEMEAHRVCMFTYWHRYFLLGFENMLRSLGPDYACITIPYWDQMQQNARAMTGGCSSIESCAPMIRDWGGSTTGLTKSVKINGEVVNGYICATGRPLDRFCQASSVTGDACAHCLPRSNLKTKAFPAMASYASVFRQLFSSKSFVATGKSVEEGMHNAIHSTLGSTMETLVSPADPIFWSHHAYVDLLLTIYLKCGAGLGKLSDAQKQTNPYTFVSCPRRENTGMFNTTATVTMRNGENGVNPIQANAQNSPLYAFFKDVPSQYALLSDVTTLGVHRYTYQIGGLIGQLGSQCTSAPQTRRLEQEHAAAVNATRVLQSRVGCHSDLAEDAPAPPSTTYDDSAFDVEPSDAADVPSQKVNAWVDEVTALLQQLPVDKSREPVAHPEIVEMERMVCMYYEECYGGTPEYSDAFKKAFGATELPPCRAIVDEIKASECKQLRLPNWKQVMDKYFVCSGGAPVETVVATGSSSGSNATAAYGAAIGDE